SAQLVSALASVLLVLPMFYLGKELFDRRVAFWATLLFQCLPASARVMPDGLSESLFFLLCASAFLFAVRGLRTGAAPTFLLAGGWSGPDVSPCDRYGWAAWAVASVLSKGFYYVLWIPALLALWCCRERFRAVPGTWVLPLTGLALVPPLYLVAQQIGYAGE